MIRKITAISFIFLFIFLIGTVSATSLENETQTIEISDKQTNLETSLVSNEKEKTATTLYASDINMYYKDNTRFTATLKDISHPITNENLTVNINGINYTRTTNETGQISLALNLESGDYTIKTIYSGSDLYHKSSIISNLHIKSTIENKDLTKYYKSSSQYFTTFKTSDGKLLENTEITFNINGVFYTRTTNNQGVAKLNINLDSGKYIITSYNPKTKEKTSRNITVLPTITANQDLIKYYKSNTPYSVHLVDLNGSSLKNGQVTFNINGVFYQKNSDAGGHAYLNINLKPGHYTITATHNGCSVSNKIFIKSQIETSDLNLSYDEKNAFKAFITTTKSIPVGAGENITFNINGVFYTRQTNVNSVASLNINLNPGEYIITTIYNNTEIGNKIIVYPPDKPQNSNLNERNFTYELAIPNYVNVTMNNVITKNNYTVKSGENGIVKLPKQQIFTIDNNIRNYTISTYKLTDETSTLLTNNYIFVPLDSNKLKTGKTAKIQKNSGILIYCDENNTYFKYYNTAERNIEEFGISIIEIEKTAQEINYIANGGIIARITINITGFDDYGIENNLALANIDSNSLKFTLSNETISLDQIKNVKCTIKEKINTLFMITDNVIEKSETIYYGEYRYSYADFETIQSFGIINSKVTTTDVESLILSLNYYSNPQTNYVKGMLLAGVYSGYLSDLNADKYAKDYNVSWYRSNSVVMFSGINIDKTYLHISNPNMGMTVTGENSSDIYEFKFINSLFLTEIERYVMSPIAKLYNSTQTNAFDEVIGSILKSEISFVKLGDLEYIFCENGNKSFMVLNTTTGVCSMILFDDDFIYKGCIEKNNDVCSLHLTPLTLQIFAINTLNDAQNLLDNAIKNNLQKFLDNIHDITKYLYGALTIGSTIAGLITGGSLYLLPITVIGLMETIRKYVNDYRINYVEEKYTYGMYKTIPLSRPSYFQDTKLFSIPKENWETDYVEVPINKDNSLNRDKAKYISKEQVRNLTKKETYQYFDEEYWTPSGIPSKYKIKRMLTYFYV
jgi:hypothetical protein